MVDPPFRPDPTSFETDVQWVDAWTLRARFNAAQIWERAQRGEVVSYVRSERHPARPLAAEPHCTRSQIVEYFLSDGTPLARAHQYLRQNGELGLSGRPDPKRFFDGAALLGVRQAPETR